MTPLNTLTLKIETDEREIPLRFPVRQMINAGFAGRNRQAIDAHIEEMRREGIPPPTSVPALYPLTADNVTTADRIEVLGPDTSGEAEFVLLVQSPEEIFVAAGSDHTDRLLERQSIEKSKQICKNVVSLKVWRLSDVERDWDELVLQSWVGKNGEQILYQKASLGTILPPRQLLDFVWSRMKSPCHEGLIVFSGTIPMLGGKFICGDRFRVELQNPRTGRSLECAYECSVLDVLRNEAR
ncbi:MAG TPA: DUF2848 family protein [Pirellulaceae bacterium]|jgi:hypothetical protein